jgi:FkbM family methyltransferase
VLEPSGKRAVEILRPLLSKLINRAGQLPVVGPLLREYARRFPEGSVVTIRSGFAAGLKWRRHHRYVNGYWIGNYEYDIQRALVRLLGPDPAGRVFYDVGANAGFFSVLVAKQVGPSGRVFAFEPLAENIASIEEQIEENKLRQIELVTMAVGASPGTCAFSFPPGQNSIAHLGEARAVEERTTEVTVTTLDAFVKDHPHPTLVKIDVEGAETDVLSGAAAVIAAGTRFLIELHGPDKAAQVVTVLRAAGYAFERLDGSPATTPEAEHHLIAQRP